MLERLCPYAFERVSLYFHVCVLMLSCLCPYAFMCVSLSKKIYVEGDVAQRIGVGRSVQKRVNQRIHKQACS